MLSALLTLPLNIRDERCYPVFREQAHYSIADTTFSRFRYVATSLSDGHRFEVVAEIHNKVRSSTVDYTKGHLARSSMGRSNFVFSSPSGHKSTYFAYVKERGRISGFYADDHVVAVIAAFGPTERHPRAPRDTARPVDMTSYLPEFEQVGRFTLSAFLGTKSVAKQSTAFAGSSLATRESAYSDTRFVRLESAAKAAGWSMAKGEHNITAQLTKAGRPTLIFVAAAPSFKKGPTWTDLPDVPLIVDDELWVPTTALASL